MVTFMMMVTMMVKMTGATVWVAEGAPKLQVNPLDLLQGNSERPPGCSTLYLGLWTFSLVSYFFVYLPGQQRNNMTENNINTVPFLTNFFAHLCSFVA